MNVGYAFLVKYTINKRHTSLIFPNIAYRVEFYSQKSRWRSWIMG
jgi:hypothetical protein